MLTVFGTLIGVFVYRMHLGVVARIYLSAFNFQRCSVECARERASYISCLDALNQMLRFCCKVFKTEESSHRNE